MKRERRKGNIAGLSALLLFGVFAVCILFVLLTGAASYQRLVERDQSAYSRRTAAQYITTRVRQADGAGRITVGKFGGADALMLTEEIDGVSFCTRIYCYDGVLRELYALAEEEFEPLDGEELLPVQYLELELEGQLLTVVITNDDGSEQKLILYLRSGEEDES